MSDKSPSLSRRSVVSGLAVAGLAATSAQAAEKKPNAKPAETSAVTPGDDMGALTPAEQKLAKEHLAFIEKTRNAYFARVDKMNGGKSAYETRDITTDNGIYAVKVGRGTVAEKAGFFTSIVTSVMPPFLGEPKWNRYMEIDVHAKNPLSPFLHLTLTFQFMKDGTSNCGGWMDVLEGPKNPAEMDIIRGRMDETFKKHNIDPKPFRDRILRKREDNPYRRHPAGAGVTLLPPPERDITKPNADFVRDSFSTMLDAFLDLVEKQKDLPFTEADLAAQEAMRKNWLEDQLFSDPFSGKLVPYSVWGVSNAPPVVKL